MRVSSRLASALVLALAGLASVGCGGNSGTQPTVSSRVLSLHAAGSYAPTAAPVETLEDGRTIGPIATFDASRGQRLVVWGSRDGSGNVASVYETAYVSDAVAHPIYARYDADGNLLSVKDSGTGSYVTVSALDTSDATNQGSIVAVGYDGQNGSTGSVRATLKGSGVTVAVIESGRSTPRTRFVSNDEIDDALAKRSAASRGLDPLAGFSTVYRGSDARTRIIAAVFRAAALVVDEPFDAVVTDVASFLLLDQLQASYTTLVGQGILPSEQTDGATPIPYVEDLPKP